MKLSIIMGREEHIMEQTNGVAGSLSCRRLAKRARRSGKPGWRTCSPGSTVWPRAVVQAIWIERRREQVSGLSAARPIRSRRQPNATASEVAPNAP